MQSSCRFVGNLELCGLPIQKLCRGSLGFPAILPHPETISTPGTNILTSYLQSFEFSDFTHFGSVIKFSFFLSVETSEVQPIPTRKTSHFLNGVLIGAMSTMGLALLVILGFLWVCLLSRKGKMGKKYIKVDKQRVQDVGKD